MAELLTARELAQYLKLNPVTVLRKARKGEIPAIKVGQHFRFDKNQIDKWLVQKTVGRTAHILVVDDEPMVGQFFMDGLNKNGYHIMATVSGLEAIDLVATSHFDLIFLDLIMPVLDGCEIFKRIRKVDEHVPIAIITGYPDSDQMKKILDLGPILVLKKPLHMEDVIKTIQNFASSSANKD